MVINLRRKKGTVKSSYLPHNYTFCSVQLHVLCTPHFFFITSQRIKSSNFIFLHDSSSQISEKNNTAASLIIETYLQCVFKAVDSPKNFVVTIKINMFVHVADKSYQFILHVQ